MRKRLTSAADRTVYRNTSCRSTGGQKNATCLAAQPETPNSTLSISQQADGVTVKIGEQLFTRYLVRSGPRPVLWPVIGPTNKRVTRSFPVAKPEPGEATDHIHHRSIWVGFEGLNDVDFWHELEPGRQRTFAPGTTVHRQFATLQSDGNTALLVAQNDWLDPQQNRVCQDERTLRFGADANQRWIDYQILFHASDGPLRVKNHLQSRWLEEGP